MNYILRVFIQRGLGVLMFLLGSWWTMNLRAWVYFIGYFLITIISCYIMHNVNKETLAERGKINTDSPKYGYYLADTSNNNIFKSNDGKYFSRVYITSTI